MKVGISTGTYLLVAKDEVSACSGKGKPGIKINSKKRGDGSDVYLGLCGRHGSRPDCGLDLWPNDWVHWGIFRLPWSRMGAELFEANWIQAIVRIFLLEKLAWVLHVGGTCGLAVFECYYIECQSEGGKPRSVIHGAKIHCWIYGGRPFSFRCAGGISEVQCVLAGRDNQRGITGMGRVTSAPWQGNIIDESAEFRLAGCKWSAECLEESMPATVKIHSN